MVDPDRHVLKNKQNIEGLQIRARVPEDAGAIADLHNLPGYRFGTLRTPYHTREEIRKAIETQTLNTVSLVAILDGKLVGDIGMTRYQNRRAHCASLGMGVHDDYVRRGIGRALMHEIATIADQWLNVLRLELTVYTDNEPALKLYRSFGFEVEGTLRAFAFRDGEFVDAYTMARMRKHI